MVAARMLFNVASSESLLAMKAAGSVNAPM
jgi:hypothetical protein